MTDRLITRDGNSISIDPDLSEVVAAMVAMETEPLRAQVAQLRDSLIVALDGLESVARSQDEVDDKIAAAAAAVARKVRAGAIPQVVKAEPVGDKVVDFEHGPDGSITRATVRYR